MRSGDPFSGKFRLQALTISESVRKWQHVVRGRKRKGYVLGIFAGYDGGLVDAAKITTLGLFQVDATSKSVDDNYAEP